MTERYEPKHVTQDDGSRCWTTNCWAAAGAWGADGASGGQRTPEPTYFRFKARQGGSCGPGSIADIAMGLMNMDLWRRCAYRFDISGPQLRAMLARRSGLLAIIPTDFERWPDRKCQPGFVGYHAVGVVCGLGYGERRGMVKAMNPLCREYTWVDIDQVVASAVEFGVEHGEGRTADCIVVTPPKA
jgi:hypothetical protein